MAFNRCIFVSRTLLRSKTLQFSLVRMMGDIPIKEIKFEELNTKLKSKEITLIDVREPKELNEDGKIPNSVNIPLGEVADAFKLPDSTFQSKYGFSKPSEEETFAISCRSGKRATTAFNKLFPIGFKNATVYVGSFQDWVKNGGSVEKN